jgi:TM2 domain-containing membrane protein YozV
MPEQVPKFYKNPAIATVLSFLFAGLGQIYNGEIGKGIVFMGLYFFSLMLMLVIVGFVTTPILWIWGMVDANSSAKRINEHLASQ